MSPRASRTCVLAFASLFAGVAHAQTTRQERPPSGAEEEKRRKLLKEIGLDKDARPRSPSPSEGAADSDHGASGEAAAAAPGAPPSRSSTGGKPAVPAAPSFRRAIHPLLMSTCGACHRSGGPAAATRFLLTGDAAADHAVVARLVTIGEPSTSALLVKVSGLPHGGGSLWPTQSAPYARVLAWIAGGARLDRQAGEPAATAAPPVEVPPSPSRRKQPVVAQADDGVPEPASPGPPPPSPIQAPPSSVAKPAAPDFARDVHPILMSACAPCHRAGGPAAATRLVLTGIPATDEATVRALVDIATPDESVLLRKASGTLHGGGVVLAPGNMQYQIVRAWVVSASTSESAPAKSADASPPAGVALQSRATPSAAPASAPAPGGTHGHGGGVLLPLGFMLNGRFDLAYERRQFSGDPFSSGGVDALRSYHHFLFLSRSQADEPCGLAVEILTLQFWEAQCRLAGRGRPVQVALVAGKIVVPFGADPLTHQSYGGLAGFDQRILPVIWAEEGVAARLVHERGALVLTDDLFVVRGYALGRADGVLNLQNDFSPVDDARLGWGNRVGAAWMGIAAWYSAYFNPLGFGRHLFMQAVDVTIWRPRSVPVLGHFSFGVGALRADVAGGDAAGVGGPGKDYYHFGSYFQARYHPTDWLYIQYRQGLRTFDNRRGVILDNTRLTSADGSTHSFGVVARYRGLTAGVYYFINLEKVDEIPDDVLRVSLAYEF